MVHCPFEHSWPCGHWVFALQLPVQVPIGFAAPQLWQTPFAQTWPAWHCALVLQTQVLFAPLQPGVLHWPFTQT